MSDQMLDQKHNTIHLGGKFNVGNYSSFDLNIWMAVPNQDSDEANHEALTSTVELGRKVLGGTLLEAVQVPPTERQDFINETIPRYLQQHIKSHPFAVYLLSGVAGDIIEEEQAKQREIDAALAELSANPDKALPEIPEDVEDEIIYGNPHDDGEEFFDKDMET